MKTAFVVFAGILLLLIPRQVKAADVPWGVHLLQPQELPLVLPYKGDSGQFFVTVPMELDDRDQKTWNEFFELCLKSGVTPIVRWVTTFSEEAWAVPNRKDIIDASTFLRSLNWAGKRYVVLFNEPNHAAEWGGSINPEEYVDLAHFAAQWLNTESYDYAVLPAGLDAAAPNSGATMDSFSFIDRMYRHDPEFFQAIDGWTSHAYPNPGFISSPYSRGKNSVLGFSNELTRLKTLTGRDYDVYITETGWRVSGANKRLMPGYYRYMVNNIWSHSSVKAVTPFVLRGFSGPFSEFSLLNEQNQPTPQFQALLNAVKP